MTEDARFEDAGESPLRLRAFDADDLAVISALLQDSVLPGSEIRWERGARRLALLVNRFRWERPARPPERVQSLLVVEGVEAVRSQGIVPGDGDTVLSILAAAFEPGDAPGGDVVLTFAGDGAIAARVEALEVVLRDVTRPYVAPSGKTPHHPE
ncbi:DUF2948 family protein [Ponticoccus sp. SC2-23]|uniref:DUF2948 family protein n=1 Tax=Alexandriicola marinus TaxID=2081710 RepID=UPI000FDBBD3B|nr:DUF2948 family protein [Alexandriicola marinus]MBM1222351.1 DUF2948 family protein [Ponticoccus sp. SC6-9]MBM1224464.1 DUF2948 family protein [Ponticoccus sp. SC6-15]MBM1229756.1 DUF2948 family protein [Ponticoccus sp. SC6-38]MBM1233430.1 DUF2948 family protein [Ponticoccus sp. SC6-45]MBM1236620.1 DUF2948 family protein [Ponticoccus sp. SC6-49]MBM1244664.1 DUF2948 family protein [Ponticoccus sp. SC2-64]MBM1246954.1 DUF2948 family protein [Ponticoccus sp. SC6-42]MBM1251432.1 DUF2948 famil